MYSLNEINKQNNKGSRIEKVYKKLTKEQREKGIIFTSSLSEDRAEGDRIHEVLSTDEDKEIKIRRLKNDKFFNNSPYNYNIIRV